MLAPYSHAQLTAPFQHSHLAFVLNRPMFTYSRNFCSLTPIGLPPSSLKRSKNFSETRLLAAPPRLTLHSFLPFLSGPRSCLGQWLATLEGRVVAHWHVQLALHFFLNSSAAQVLCLICRYFDFEAAAGMDESQHRWAATIVCPFVKAAASYPPAHRRVQISHSCRSRERHVVEYKASGVNADFERFALLNKHQTILGPSTRVVLLLPQQQAVQDGGDQGQSVNKTRQAVMTFRGRVMCDVRRGATMTCT
jgi:hypothetical protein